MADWKPSGYPSISPYLICKNPEALIAFVQKAFDGVLLRRVDRPGGSLMHAEVRIDDSVIMIGGGETDHQSMHVHIHLYVSDAKWVFDQAIAAGATQVQEPVRKRPEDDLRGGVQDQSGTIWWIATQ